MEDATAVPGARFAPDWHDAPQTREAPDALDVAPSDDETWRRFDARQRPIVAALARRLGLDANDADEVAQRTLVDVARGVGAGSYQTDRGSLQAWLMGIARHRAMDVLRERRRHRAPAPSDALVARDEDASPARAHQLSFERAAFDRALRRLRQESRTRPKTLAAFERLVLNGATPRQVAAEFGLSVDEVYRVKCRLVRRLRELTAPLTDERGEENPSIPCEMGSRRPH